jgi:hypothetical protein
MTGCDCPVCGRQARVKSMPIEKTSSSYACGRPFEPGRWRLVSADVSVRVPPGICCDRPAPKHSSAPDWALESWIVPKTRSSIQSARLMTVPSWRVKVVVPGAQSCYSSCRAGHVVSCSAWLPTSPWGSDHIINPMSLGCAAFGL